MEQENELEEDTRSALNAMRALKELRESEGWRILKTIIEKQIKSRVDNVMLTPRKDMATEWEREFQKGEAAALRLVLELPEIEYATLEAVKEHEDVNAEPDASADTDDTASDIWDRPSFGP